MGIFHHVHAVWMMRLMFVLIAAAVRSNQFLFLSFILFIFMVFHTANGLWYGDFWMHSNVVRELATHPLFPRHPELLLSAPHAFYSPYSLTIAWMARVFNINSITALSWAGIFNFLLFVISLRMLIVLLLGEGKRPFYTLFFTLFLWGPGAWNYSGFFHFGVIGYVLPYPSTFAMGMVFLSLSMAILYLENRSKWGLFLLLIFSVIILLTHPLSAIVLYAGILALAIGHKNRGSPHLFIDSMFISAVIPLSFLIALAWPYYPLLKLVLSSGAVLDIDNSKMYHGLWWAIFPALIGFPPLMLRVKSNWKDPLALMFMGLVIVYIYGGISNHFTYGRVISSIVLILHMALADWLCSNARFKSLPVGSKCLFVLILFLSLLGIYHNCNAQSMGYMPGRKNDYNQYLFLKKYTKQYDVILSDQETSFIVPTFGGKVVALNCPLPFIEGYKTRQNDLDRFFDKETTLNVREGIIKKYGVNYILINKDKLKNTALFQNSDAFLGRQIYADKSFILFKVN